MEESKAADTSVIKVQVGNATISFNSETNEVLWEGTPLVLFWVNVTMADMMHNMKRLIGLERFNLAMMSGGREGVDGDWGIILKQPSFEEGFQVLSDFAWVAGWGRWKLISLDREKQEMRFQVWNGWEAGYQKALGVVWGSSMMAGKLAGYGTRLFGTNCWTEQVAFAARGDAYDEFIVRPSPLTLERELENQLRSSDAMGADLPVALEKLEREIREREQVEQELRDKLAVIEKQKADITALSTPIVQIWRGVLMLPVIGVLDSDRAGRILEALLARIVSTASRYAILDLTGVEQVDASTADHLVRIVRSVELIGARSVLTGIRPAVAQALISLGADLHSMMTRGNLEEGLQACIEEMAARRR